MRYLHRYHLEDSANPFYECCLLRKDRKSSLAIPPPISYSELLLVATMLCGRMSFPEGNVCSRFSSLKVI